MMCQLHVMLHPFCFTGHVFIQFHKFMNIQHCKNSAMVTNLVKENYQNDV